MRKRPSSNFRDEVFGIVDIGGGGYADKVVLDQQSLARKPAGQDHSVWPTESPSTSVDPGSAN